MHITHITYNPTHCFHGKFSCQLAIILFSSNMSFQTCRSACFMTFLKYALKLEYSLLTILHECSLLAQLKQKNSQTKKLNLKLKLTFKESHNAKIRQ